MHDEDLVKSLRTGILHKRCQANHSRHQHIVVKRKENWNALHFSPRNKCLTMGILLIRQVTPKRKAVITRA